MRVRERVGHLACDAAHIVDVQDTLVVETLRQVVAADVGHHEEHEPFRFVDSIDRNDVRMAQLRGGFGLAKESCLDRALKRELGREYFDGDVPLEAPVAGAIHHAHAAAPDLTVQLVVSAEDPFDVNTELRARRRSAGIGRRLG